VAFATLLLKQGYGMRKSNLIIAIFMLVFPLVGVTQEANQNDQAEELKELCKKQLCRGGAISLELADGEALSFELEQPMPIVFDDFVVLLPGDTIFLTGQISGDSLINLKALDSPVDGELNIKLSFSQKIVGENSMMLLSVTNPYDRFLKYHAAMTMPDEEGAYETSSCAVRPGLTTGESWPHPILQLELFEFRLLPKDMGEQVCEF
jgi:hypothetical protein